ncbi:hypothetical protein IRA69_04015 [Campylobacter hepaticus]|nr:hypothetical protein IRA69_03860 [Campylobacter hepaticus]QOW63235.1 hypothetical protein IRA69_04015 [Campylobacter hepaticus]
MKNISNESSGDVMLNNTGSITKGITNSGNGNLSLTNQEKCHHKWRYNKLWLRHPNA